MQKITPFLWFDNNAEEAVNFYTSIFKNSKIKSPAKYDKNGEKVSGQPAGSVMTIPFEIEGQEFIALNGGPVFKFTEAVSFIVNCDSQEEVDYFWNTLSEGGDPNAQQCGWLKDKFGLSWQVVPKVLDEMMADPDKEKSGRAMKAMLEMKKLVIEDLRKAFEGQG